MRAGGFGPLAKPTAVTYSAVVKYLGEAREIARKRPSCTLNLSRFAMVFAAWLWWPPGWLRG